MCPKYSLGLVPLKNLLIGEVNKSVKVSNGPFQTIDRYNQLLDSKRGEASQAYRFYQRATNLKNYCDAGGKISYLTEAQRKRGLKSFMASFRYFGLIKISSDISKLINELEFEDEKKSNLSNNLVDQYCSNNLSVISKRQLKVYLKKIFTENNEKQSKEKTPGENLFSKFNIKENSLKRAIRNFRNFCSWTGQVDHLGLLADYLYSPLFIQRGLDYFFDSENTRYGEVVACENNICRKLKDDTGALFQRSISSTSIESDFRENYCKYFYNKELIGKKNNSSIRAWQKADNQFEGALDLLYFLKVTGVGDNLLNNSTDSSTYNQVLESHLDQYFDTWALGQLNSSDNNFTYEEKISVKKIESRGDEILLDVNSGPADEVFEGFGRLILNVDLELRSKYIIWWRREFSQTSPKRTKKIQFLKNNLALNLNFEIERRMNSVPIYKEINADLKRILLKYFYTELLELKSVSKEGVNTFKVKLNYSPFVLKKIYEKQKVMHLTVKKK